MAASNIYKLYDHNESEINSNSSKSKSGKMKKFWAFHRGKFHDFSVKHYNKVLGLVYIGAAVLVIIVGLRGLGSIVGDLAIIPSFFIDPASNKIDSDIVMFALILEFCMLMLLAAVTFFTPHDELINEGEEDSEKQLLRKLNTLDAYKISLEEVKNYTDAELNALRSYLYQYEEMTNKLAQIQSQNVENLKKISEYIKR